VSGNGDLALTELAGAILDGSPIDWETADSDAAPEDRPVVRRLKSIAAIARAHHGGEPKTWGSLRLLEPIGRGAFGDVYRAWDSRLDRQVALKLLAADPSESKQLATSIIEEGRLLARVRHPNVVTIYGAERIDDRVGLWMEYIDGRTLHQLVVVDGRRFAPRDVAAIGQALCGAVAAVHAAGLLHRDIKAQNVMMAGDGRVVLMDFGSGRDRGGTSEGDLAGTPLYLAPEVLSGASPPSVQSDIYSTGVLLFFLLTGTYPVTGADLAALHHGHERGERRSLKPVAPKVPRRLRLAIERAIDPRAKRRHESADALRADLAAVLPRPRLVRLASATGVAVVVMLLAGLGWEAAGRQMGVSRTPSTLLKDFAGFGFGGPAGVSPAERPVIAVLPFKNLSAEPDSEYFVDGLTGEIIRDLGVVQGLQVRSRTSSFAFKDQPRDLRSIGEQLGVNLVVEGSVLRSGTKLQIHAQLVQIAGDIRLWADQFDRELEDIFSIQAEISRAIVNELRLTLDPDRQHHDANLDAYDLYLRARALVDRRGIANAQQAAEMFARIAAMDPEFAPAYAGLANAYAFMSFPYRGIAFERAYPIMRPAAVKALQLDPMLAEGHATMGWVYSYEREWADAEKSFQQSIRLNPSLTQTYTSYSISTLQPLRKYDEALRLMEVASQNDPLSLDVQREIGEVQLFSGRYAEAIDTFQRVLRVDPHFPFVQTYLARALIYDGKVAQALPLLPQIGPWHAQAYVMTGRRGEAEKLAAELEGYPYSLTIAAAALGETDRAVNAMERAAISEPHRMGRLLIEPELAALREHPRVVALRKRLNLP
jgi:TolB-like protein/tRNA A-37 threonylcarbamoyl transferase component Bud32